MAFPDLILHPREHLTIAGTPEVPSVLSEKFRETGYFNLVLLRCVALGIKPQV